MRQSKVAFLHPGAALVWMDGTYVRIDTSLLEAHAQRINRQIAERERDQWHTY